MANFMAAERGEENVEGEVCGLVAMVILVEYHSMSGMNSGMWSWWKMENRSS